MAILRPATPETPLQQGDLLRDVITATTDGDGPACPKPGMVLVVSRNCQAIRSKHVVVARVVKKALAGLKEQAESIDQIRRFLAQLRDGDGAPDTFYLGELETDSTDRYVAKFDQLFTIKIPEESEARASFLRKHRSFALTPEFAHDLHQRLFRAFASMGFDDVEWFTDADLSLIVEYGRSMLESANAEIATTGSRLQLVVTSGGNNKEEKELKKALELTKGRAAKLKVDLGPLETELRARRPKA